MTTRSFAATHLGVVDAVSWAVQLRRALGQKRRFALLGLVLLCAAPFAAKALGWRPPNALKWAWMRLQGPEYPTEDLSTFRADVTPEGQDALQTFEFLRKAIRTKKLQAEHAILLPQVVSEPVHLRELQQLMAKLDGDSPEDLFHRIYAKLITAPSHPDVAYDAIARDIQTPLSAGARNNHLNIQPYAWSWSYAARAAVEAFTATGQSRFLDLVVSSFDEILRARDTELGRRDVVRGRVLRSWGLASLGDRWGLPGGGHVNVVTTPGRIGFPVLLFVQQVQAEPERLAQYHEPAQRYLEAINQAVDEFDEAYRTTETGSAGYYWELAKDEIEKLNHMLSMGRTVVLLAQLTKDPKYKLMAEQMARFFRQSLWVENDAYVWTYAPKPGKPRGPPERVWKAQVTVGFAPVAYDAGIEFHAEDMRKFANTFLRNIHRGGNRFNRDIGAEDNPYVFDQKRTSWTSSYLPWILFDRFEPRIRSILDDAVATRTDLFPKGWFGSSLGTMAYAHRLQASPNNH